jgi:hypothetical protein
MISDEELKKLEALLKEPNVYYGQAVASIGPLIERLRAAEEALKFYKKDWRGEKPATAGDAEGESTGCGCCAYNTGAHASFYFAASETSEGEKG